MPVELTRACTHAHIIHSFPLCPPPLSLPPQGAPKGFLPEWRHAQVEGGVAGAVDAGGGDVAEVSADAAIGDEDTNATETGVLLTCGQSL